MIDEVRCAPWTLAEGIDPAGSAVRIDRLVLVELPLPWPPDIGDTAWLAGHGEPDGTRLQAIVPEAPRLDGLVLVTVWERHGARFEGVDWLVRAEHVRDLIGGLVAGHEPDPSLDRELRGAEAPPEILVCGHGSRDRCCGGSGTRLAVEARAALAEVRVRRTSHLGGHRFAPTALSMPDGRAWAYLDAAAIVGIVEHTLDPAQARSRYRGHVGLDSWAQVVEADRLLSVGWDFAAVSDLSAVVDIDDDAADDDETAHVTLTWDDADGGGEQVEQVRVRRRYPVLQCGFGPEAATKTAPEYEIV